MAADSLDAFTGTPDVRRWEVSDKTTEEAVGIERALRIRLWNELRERGVAQDEAIRQVNAEIEAIKAEAHDPD